MRTRRSHPATAGQVIPVASAAPPAHQPRTPRDAPEATYHAVMADIRKARPMGGRHASPQLGSPETGGAHHKKPTRAPGQFQSEHVLQIAVAQYLDRALPEDAFWTSIDSAGRGPRDGARMKRRGVKRGLPDIVIVWQSTTLWIELKSATGRLTNEQKHFLRAIERAGHDWAVCRSVQEVEYALRSYPLRARIAA